MIQNETQLRYLIELLKRLEPTWWVDDKEEQHDLDVLDAGVRLHGHRARDDGSDHRDNQYFAGRIQARALLREFIANGGDIVAAKLEAPVSEVVQFWATEVRK